jgi:hypothetical protein
MEKSLPPNRACFASGASYFAHMLVSETPASSAEPTKSNTPPMTSPSEELLPALDTFPRRHIGPDPDEIEQMCRLLGYTGLDELADAVVPKQIRLARKLDLPPGRGEHQVLADLKAIASQNQVCRSFIGMGYYDCITPPVIQRNVLENPGWYTPYTPYQAEIAQGRLEGLLNFQTMVSDLTGLDIANASLLDEATAAAEAMHLCQALHPERNRFFVSNACHPQTIAVVQTRARALGIELEIGDYQEFKFNDKVFGALVQYPDTFGRINDYSNFVESARTWPSGAHNGLAYRWDSAGLMRLSSPHATLTSATCRVELWASRRIREVVRPCGSRCKRASSIFAGKRPPATFALPRRCWRTWRLSTRFIMERRG